MPDLSALLELAKSAATEAGRRLLDDSRKTDKNYVHSLEQPREVKALADTVLEQTILSALAPAGLPILSEEAGYIPSRQASDYWFIVDPLDGTFNFVKSLGPSAVSIALWEGKRPVFGVIYSLVDRQLAWGGAGMGSYANGGRISVSTTVQRESASICTGFPVRFDLASDHSARRFWQTIRPYARVRMLGSAAVSLLHVAKGSADAYSEDNIMLWDVAAGLAIVEGAGGVFAMEEAGRKWSCRIFASNPALLPPSSEEGRTDEAFGQRAPM